MLTLVWIPLMCWGCVLLAIPHSPRSGEEVEELVYRRLVGRHQLLCACATILTLVSLLALIFRALTRELS